MHTPFVFHIFQIHFFFQFFSTTTSEAARSSQAAACPALVSCLRTDVQTAVYDHQCASESFSALLSTWTAASQVFTIVGHIFGMLCQTSFRLRLPRKHLVKSHIHICILILSTIYCFHLVLSRTPLGIYF